MAAVACISMAGAETIVWHSMDDFPIYGKITDSTATRYSRLPAYLESKVRPGVWNLGKHTAGEYLRFRTNSHIIKVRWGHSCRMSMRHMTDIGCRGLDLYMWDDGKWWFAGAAFPVDKEESESTLVYSLDGTMHECMMYLSLYDGLSHLEIGIEEGASLLPAELNSPRQDLKPIIMYGTSILQGGCANRPGMAYTNIISRRLDRTVINLGFSGNAKIDDSIAEFMASYPAPAMYVLDYVPNCTAKMVTDSTAKFVRILSDAHPETPIVFVELHQYANWHFHTKNAASTIECNKALKAEYKKLIKAGYKNLYYIDNKNLNGSDCEATVDGTHLTDLGMLRYADKVTPILKSILNKEKIH